MSMETTELQVVNLPGKGRGVVAKRAFAPGDEIEVCPVIVLDIAAKPAYLMAYLFYWERGFALAFGYGSLYNHSASPNADWTADEERRTITFFALRPIEPGDEICFDYNGSPEVLKQEFGIE